MDRTDDHDRAPYGQYANYFEVGHNADEFIIDFAQAHADRRNPSVGTRAVMGPVYAKSLLQTLQQSVDAYQRAFGELEGDDGPPEQSDLNADAD